MIFCYTSFIPDKQSVLNMFVIFFLFSDNHHIKFDEKKAKKSKKNKKDKEVETVEQEIEKKKSKKRKLDISPSETSIDWSSTIKESLKEQDTKSMEVKSLRKLVFKKLQGDLGDMTKTEKKTLFDEELAKVKKVSVEGSIVKYCKKEKI